MLLEPDQRLDAGSAFVAHRDAFHGRFLLSHAFHTEPHHTYDEVNSNIAFLQGSRNCGMRRDSVDAERDESRQLIEKSEGRYTGSFDRLLWEDYNDPACARCPRTSVICSDCRTDSTGSEFEPEWSNGFSASQRSENRGQPSSFGDYWKWCGR